MGRPSRPIRGGKLARPLKSDVPNPAYSTNRTVTDTLGGVPMQSFELYLGRVDASPLICAALEARPDIVKGADGTLYRFYRFIAPMYGCDRAAFYKQATVIEERGCST